MRLLILIISFFISTLSYSQTIYKPTIVVLDPYQTKYDTSLLAEIDTFSKKSIVTPEEDKEYFKSLAAEEKNIQKMKMAEWEFTKNMDYGSYVTFSLEIMLTYAVFGETDKCIVIPSHDTSNGQISNLKTLAIKHDVLWVVNPLYLHTYIKDGNKYSSLRLQVYDTKKNKIVLDKEYTGDTKNPGFELSCESGTLECTISNVINPSLNDILLTILKHYQH